MVRKMFAFALVLALAVSLAACTATVAAPQGQPGAAQSGTSAARADKGKTDGTRISEEEAQRIALEHAGLKADQVTGLRVEYDVDDGVPEYDVEFRHGHWEYEYEIHAETGEIRSYDRDD